MRTFRIVLWLMTAGGLLLLADVRPSPSDAAARPNPERELESKPVRNTQPVSDSEWSDIEKWMAVNCPNQLNFLRELSDKNGQKEHARQLIAERYRAWNHASDNVLKDAMLAQVKANDTIFGYQILYRQAKGDRQRRREIREKLRGAVRQLIEAQVSEKNARIARLQQDVERIRSDKYAEGYTNVLLGEVGGRPFPPAQGSSTQETSAVIRPGPAPLTEP